jgi:hypothetical protein
MANKSRTTHPRIANLPRNIKPATGNRHGRSGRRRVHCNQTKHESGNGHGPDDQTWPRSPGRQTSRKRHPRRRIRRRSPSRTTDARWFCKLLMVVGIGMGFFWFWHLVVGMRPWSGRCVMAGAGQVEYGLPNTAASRHLHVMLSDAVGEVPSAKGAPPNQRSQIHGSCWVLCSSTNSYT